MSISVDQREFSKKAMLLLTVIQEDTDTYIVLQDCIQ